MQTNQKPIAFRLQAQKRKQSDNFFGNRLKVKALRCAERREAAQEFRHALQGLTIADILVEDKNGYNW